MAGPLRTYRKRIQFIMRKLKEVDVDALMPSPECPTDQLQKVKLAMPEVMQTLFEAEQVCAELQHSVSGLDSRLAELLHWETEARDLYQLLRAAEQQKQRGQDPRARVLISRGLQLEGQVVTEEQDLQVMVMTNQKSSPIQYLHASAIQDRVRAAVAQSQETVGMLSSLGARRDRSRSPPDDSPPSKVLVQTKQKPQHLRQSDTSQLMQQPETKPPSPKPPTPTADPQTHSQPMAHPPPKAHPQAPAQSMAQWSQLNLQFQELPSQPKHQAQLQPQPKAQDEKPSQPKPQAQLAPQPAVPSPSQTKVQPAAQPKAGSVPQPAADTHLPPQPVAQSPTTPKAGSPPQPRPQTQPAPQPEVQAPTQTTVQSPPQPKAGSPPQSKPQTQPAPQPEPQPLTQTKVQSPPQPKAGSPPQSKPQTQPAPQPEVQPPTQTKVQSPPQPKAGSPPQSKPQTQPAPQPEPQPLIQTKVQSPPQQRAQSQPQPKPQTQLPPQNQLQAQSPPLAKAQTTTHSKAQSPPQSRPQTQPPPQSPPQPKPQHPQTVVLSQVSVLPQSQAESPDLCFTPPALAQAPPQAYTEAYAKAQALARNGFEEAKHCLQEHILEAINVFREKRISPDQSSVKEETLKTLDPELLEGFLRAAKGMEAFCTPSELRDMEFFTQSVRTQWEACFSVDGSFAQAGQHLEALKELCDTLSPEDAHRLAQTQLRECEKRLAAIQHQFSGDQDTSLPDSRISVAFSEDLTTEKERDKPQVSAEVTVKTASVEKKEVVKQVSLEEEVTKKEALERYENCKRTLQAQLSKNDQSIKDTPPDSVSLKGLHTRLQEIQFLRQETGSLWAEYGNVCSQCSQLTGNTGLEQEKSELQEQWRSQQLNLQRRGNSLAAALRQIDSTENHMVDFTDRLDRYLRQPKDITAFSLANTNILKDIKELDDNIQYELDQLSRLDSESSDLDPRDCFPLTREVETHRTSLDQLRQQVRKSEAAARALDRFLMSLRTVDEDISGVQGAPCSDATVLQDCRSKLSLIRQSIDSLKEKAPQLDLLLQGARLTVTRDGVPASCLDMVSALLRRLEEADSGLASQQQDLKKETQSKSLGLRKRTLLGEMRKLQETIEMQGLKEPTIPAVQHRLRALTDLDSQVHAQHSEFLNISELQEKQGGGENLLEELETQWKEIQRGFSDRKKQCTTLLENLKKFQSCRSHLTNTIQRAEHTISDQASYMGKDNLQRSITKVSDIKEELSGLGERMEEMRGVCRQLQTQLKKFPDCSESPFEAEADTLMDNWLDVTEKTDAYMDNLKVALELLEKQLMLGGEVDGWAVAKLTLFAESHPFSDEQQVLAMRDEIHANEENIEHFHKKSVEIQELLQSQEAPLELQVMETQLRRRMEQVKELFTDCTDVFEELIAVKKHLAEKIEECQAAVENIQASLSKVDASGSKVEEQIQDLCEDLEAREEQAESVLKEVGLVSSVASPQVLEALAVDCRRLREAISRTKDMIHLKREERDKGLLKVIHDEKQSFEGWLQDLQLLVNECFENLRAEQMWNYICKDSLETSGAAEGSAGERQPADPPQQLSDFTEWLKEQQEEVGTFRTHCHNRQTEMESLLGDLNSLQKQHDGFREWLQSKEKESVVLDKVKPLLKDLQDESGKAKSLSELLASVRRQGVRGESLLKNSDNLIQRYRNLEARVQEQAQAQSALQEECDRFHSQAESTRTWIRELLEPLTSSDRDVQTEELKCIAQTILISKAEGEYKVSNLVNQSQSLCEHEDLDQSRKQEIQESVRQTEEQWQAALQAAKEALSKAETQTLLDQDLLSFKTLNEHVQSWIGEQEQNLQSGGGQVGEKLQIAQAALSSWSEGDSKLHDLKKQCQSLCENQALDESRRQELQDAVKQKEEQWSRVLKAAEEAHNKAEAEAASEQDFEGFKTQSENVQFWIKEQKQKLLSLSSQMQFEERLQIVQAMLTSRAEGEAKLQDLKRQGESVCEQLEECRRPEVQLLVDHTEQQWRSVLQAANQAELRSLSDDFDAQSKNTQSWIRDRQQKLQSVGSHTPPEERCNTVETILSSRPEGDCKVNNLRRRGQSLCDHKDTDEGRRVYVQQTVRETEEQWRTVLQAAKQIKAAAEAQIAQETERRELELREFETGQQDNGRWLGDLQQRLVLLDSQSNAEDRLHIAQDIMSCKPDGDSRLQELRRRGQILCCLDLEEHRKRDIEQIVKDAEEKWTSVLQHAKLSLVKAEKQCALQGQLRDFETLRTNTRTWLEEKQHSLVSLDGQTEAEKIINTAQTILSSKPEGDSKLTELRRQSQSLCEHEDLEEDTRRETQQAVKDSEERWRTVLQTAEDTLKKAEVQYSISREMEALSTQALSTKSWVKDLQEQAEAKGRGTQGSKAELEDRLNTAQVILSNKSNGEAQVKELQSRAQSLCEQRNLEEEKKLQVQQMVGDIEQQWRTLLQAAEDTHRELKRVVQRLESCQRSRVQAEARLTEFQNQTSNLPRLFPWPVWESGGRQWSRPRPCWTRPPPWPLSSQTFALRLQSSLRSHRTMTGQIRLCSQSGVYSCSAERADSDLEQGIVTERQCTQLVEQHEAAQDWLREQVKGLGTPPTDRHGLHSTVNTLKALLQTVGREQREMKELDSARDNLLSLCTPGGHDALILEVSQLHSLCATSEQEVRERLTACEARLGEQQSQLARRVQDLRERAAALQWELRSLDQALSYSEPQNNIIQLLQHWHSLQNCENALEDLGVKLRDLHQDIKPKPATSELPAEIVSVVDSLCQQHDSLKSRLSERQGTCSTNTARCLTDCLQAVQQWNHSEPSDSVSSLQVTLEEGEKLQITLREALSQQRFLTDCLTPVSFEKLEKECSQTLKEAEAHKDSLNHSLKELNEKKKQKLHDIQSADVLSGNLEQKKTSVVAPPRKSKQAPEKKHQAVHKSSTDVIPDEVTRVEGLTPRENKAKESDVKTEKVSLEAPGGFTISSIFTEVQLLPGTGPSSPLSEGKSLEDSPETLVASTTDLDACLSRLVSKVLSLKNCPAELSLEAMAQQVEEAQRCRETAQQRVSSLSQQRGADDGESRTMLDSAEDQWSKAAQDAAAVIQSKEAQLQLVTDYCRQTQRAETTLDTQTAQLDAVKKSPDHSVSREAEQLSSLQRSMVENQTVFGELLLTYTKLCPHLSQSEHAAAQTKQKDLKEKWRSLERTVEMMLHHTKVHFHETSSLQSEISGLQEHLEKLNKDLEAKSPAATQWNCKKAQQLMEANAEVEAAQQKYLHLQQLSEVLLLSSRWKKETEEIQQGLQTVKNKLTHIEELVSAQTLCSSNPIMEKIIEVMTDGLGWAKKSESDIEGRRKRVALLPEEVHRQLRDLKKLQSEVMVKQVQLETLAEEVTELLPQLDQAEEVPMVRTSLESLEQISKSTTDKLAKAVREIESGLQTREKLSEQIADLDSWVVAHLHREATRSPDSEFRSPSELDHRVHQIQETLAEADKQAAVCEALLMKSKDISSELSITENCQLFEKLTNLQEDIRAISSCEKASKKELDELIQSVESNKKTLGTVEKSLKQMLVDLNKYSFPITQETLQALEPFKHMILEHKSQVELLQPGFPRK
ncbi:hypothetical protein INR49_005781 [Caranx melampygus]|nr:hypothetical protein INR49_005781 [Caranx melampygus]